MSSTSRLFPSGPVTLDLSDLLARLKAADVILASWHDPIKGLQMMPVGNERLVGPKTAVYGVRNGREVAALMAAKILLDEGNENGAYACLVAEMADETRARRIN